MNKNIGFALVSIVLAPQGIAEENQRPSIGIELGQFELRRQSGSDALAWDAGLSVSNNHHGIQLLSEGERADGTTLLHELKLQYIRTLTPNWNLTAGIQQDTGEQPRRDWLQLGIEGETFYAIETSTAIYFGKNDRQALRFEAERTFSLAPNWTITPETTINFYNQDDPALDIGSGLSHLELAARLAYEISPQASLYVGAIWGKAYGDTASYARAAGESPTGTQMVLGISATL